MMKYDFDNKVERRGTNSLKYDFFKERGKRDGLIPMWVADMEFRAPDCVLRALRERTEHGVFGYSEPDEGYFSTLCDWFSRRHGWNADADKFVVTPGVVFSICSLIRTVTKVGDGVMICEPVYYPFAESVTENGRKLTVSELIDDSGLYKIDFDDFEEKIKRNRVRAFILCNPHNPVGRVWTWDELERLGDICLKYGVFVISDEIHSDFTYGDNRHVVFSTIKKEFENICAICTAPTKTFNLAGLHVANTYIQNDDVREKFKQELNRQGYSQPNVMGLDACRAAYTDGEEWLDALNDYLSKNLETVREYASNRLKGITLIEPQGTYLVWLDCRGMGLADGELAAFFEEEAGLWVDDGAIFGRGGSGHERINVACPRSVLRDALEQLAAATERAARRK